MYFLNIISHIVGYLARIQLPKYFNQALIGWFIKRYNVETDEVTKPIESFPSLADFFVRDLKSRMIGATPVFPVDGTLRGFGAIHQGMLEQIKGKEYTLGELFEDQAEANLFEGGTYLNMYLSPRDYHHVHMPVTGSIAKVTHIPGTLFPVNDWSITRVDRLFCKNERLVFYIDSDIGKVALIMIGALNVGSMTYSDKKHIEIGERLGTFHLGSSVVLCFKSQLRLDNLRVKATIRYGSSILL